MTPSLSDRRQPEGRLPKIVAREFCATGEQRNAVLKNILSPKDQAELAKIATVLAYPTGGVAIYSEGEDAHFLYLIDDGMVRLSRHLPNGSRQVLGSCGRVTSLGWLKKAATSTGQNLLPGLLSFGSQLNDCGICC